ncbi:MAG: hypothetical protein DMF63_12160 [Acidobacteria bacterium]|nr:MAG: hypothetical protein DMF63_12160 [Acidobacteriota bacterium]
MKVKVLTSWSLIWLVVAVLLVAGGALNLSQRATHDLPPTDGVLWVQRDGGIYAEKVVPGLAASRSVSMARISTRSSRSRIFRCTSTRPASAVR